jgi:hypothetical protein
LATIEGVTAAIDQVIAYFNARKMDLPDGFFERTTQFVINGAPFETLLGQSPNDPLILMLLRGPAGYRFTITGVQHAVQNARVDRGDITTGSDPFKLNTQLWLSGQIRDTGEPINAVIDVTLQLSSAGTVEVAEAKMDGPMLRKIRQARRS